MRIDKFLVSQNICTRKEAQKLVRKGLVKIDSEIIKKPETKIDPNVNKVTVDGKDISYQEYVYIIMNKPNGYISASNDKNAETVVDLVPKEMKRKNLFPAGRLDKDTTGMLIITDDGDFAHRMLSPKKHVEKVYKATLDGEVTDEMVENFRKGISFYDGTLCLSAKLLPNKENPYIARVIIREGKYHQVKKMFLTQGLTVKDLHREQIGMLKLPKDLAPGECRFMQEDEKRNIFL